MLRGMPKEKARQMYPDAPPVTQELHAAHDKRKSKEVSRSESPKRKKIRNCGKRWRSP
jgi:hypothetical protein